MTGGDRVQVWIDGHLVDADEAAVSPLAAGWRLGDGVFSTLRTVDGEPQRVADHVARVLRDAAAIGLPAPDPAKLSLSDGPHPRPAGTPSEEEVADGLVEAVRAVARANADADLVLRVVLARGVDGTTAAVLAGPVPAGPATLTAATVEGGRRPAHVKSTSWAWSAMATAQARDAGADVALLVEGDDVLEAAAANVVVVVEGEARTPPADGRLLPGTTRAVALDLDLATEAPVTTADLARADEVVLLSAVRGAVPVVAVDGRAIGDGTSGPRAAALRTGLQDAGIGAPGR